MKKLLLLVFVLATTLLHAQSQFNLKGGLNFTQQSDIFFEDGEINGAQGFQIGAEWRLGNRLYMAPGLYYFEHQSDVTFVNEVNLDPIQIQFQGVRVPLYFGADLVRGETIGFRLYGGPNISFILNHEKDLANFFDDDPVRETLWGLNAGMGIDLGFISFDLTHEWRMDDALAGDLVKFRNNIIYFQVGILF